MLSGGSAYELSFTACVCVYDELTLLTASGSRLRGFLVRRKILCQFSVSLSLSLSLNRLSSVKERSRSSEVCECVIVNALLFQ